MNTDCTVCIHAFKVERGNGAQLIDPNAPTHACLEGPPVPIALPTPNGATLAFTHPMVGRASLRCSRFVNREMLNAVA